MTPEDMIKISEVSLESSKKISFAVPEKAINDMLNANYWVLRAIFERISTIQVSIPSLHEANSEDEDYESWKQPW
jgi:hypothetical protein